MSDVWDEMDESAGRIEREARLEQAAAEADALQLHLASRQMIEVAWTAMQQGDRIRLSWLGGSQTGVPSAAVGDLIVVATESGSAAVRVPAVSTIEVVDRRYGRGSAGDRTVESFVAWCRMIESASVTVATIGGGVVEGTLVAIAADHLLIRSGRGDEVAVARDHVAAVSVAGEPVLAL